MLDHGQRHFGTGQANLPFGDGHYPPRVPIYTDDKGVQYLTILLHGESENKSIHTDLITAGGTGVDSMGDFKLQGLWQAWQDSHTPITSLAIFLRPNFSPNDT